MNAAAAEQPLSGFRIVDFGSHLAGPLAAMLLADAGAEVVHVDPPAYERADWTAVVNRSKHNIELDLNTADGRAAAEHLIAGAGLVIESFRPGVMDRPGLGAAEMMAAHRGLVYCSVSGFPADDPRAGSRGWDQIVSAVVAAHSVVAALIGRERDGAGQRVISTLYDAAFEIIGHEFHSAGLHAPGSGFKPPTKPGTGHYVCADGRWIHLCLFDDRHLRWFGDTFAPGLADDGWFDGDALRAAPEKQDQLLEKMVALLLTRPAAEWERLINEASGAPAAVCQTAFEWLTDDAHARASGTVIELDDPLLGPTIQLGYAFNLSKAPPIARPRTFGTPPPWPPRPAAAHGAAVKRPPLDGIRVVDFTQVLAGPTCGRILADYDASVIKVNKPSDRGIPWHGWINRGKQSILLDIGSPLASPVLDQMIARADVVSQNFALGVADRLGIGEAAVRQLRPDAIYSSISAFGNEGYRKAWRGREELGQALTGCKPFGPTRPVSHRCSCSPSAM